MAIKTNPLSDTEVRSAKPKEKLYSLYDGDGLELRITKAGSKSWLFRYKRPHIGKTNYIKIGSYPETSLAQARKLRSEYRELLEKDVDPQKWIDDRAGRRRREVSTTLKNVAEKWFAVKFSEVSERHASNIRSSFDHHVYPTLGNYPVSELTAPLVIDALQPLEAADKRETITRVCQRLNEMMTWCVNTGILQHNPLAGIKAAFARAETTNMPTIRPEQLPDLMRSLSYAQIRVMTRCLIEWQLHTMVRPAEAAGARWDEIDTNKMLWTIPPERMKKKRAHVVPLTPQTLALLHFIKPISGRSEYLFPSERNQGRPTHSETANRALQRMGYKGVLVSHGLRSLASTTMNEIGFDDDLIESSLAHKGKDQVRSAYNRATYLERRRKLMEWWSDHIEEAATGKMAMAGKKGLKIV
ncbi:MAG: integrase [Rheinheimera sp.]|uniref:integrase domain-containing protein n=1 Tax=Arsukibacterium sp. UBA3155 TaxID=1946058 RepID=UPI000C899706|nr:integrase domain-containing protein [Arsukibacterium sp. UBA3155]MAD75177.1 integrase [Rheinheimera sp.]|tara:strand:+ start:16961 stop:18199 length:1239 start_codon:yes stop_codon:yes gene_type:complete